MKFIINFYNRNYSKIFFSTLSIIVMIIFIYRFLYGYKGSWSNNYFIPNVKEKAGKAFEVSRKSVTDEIGRTSSKGFQSKGELECRRVLEKYTLKKFPSSRPNIMNNEITKFNLELDCYNPELKIGCEYNGQQHYKYTPYFHKNKEAFMNQKYRDALKKHYCRNNGIFLIEVPYTIKLQDIEEYITNKLDEYFLRKSRATSYKNFYGRYNLY